MIQSFASMGITAVPWWLIGYSLRFSGGADGVYGDFTGTRSPRAGRCRRAGHGGIDRAISS